MAKKKTVKTSKPTSTHIQQKRHNIREDILNTAELILQEEGVDAVTLQSVSDRLGLTKQALYHYFPSKVMLLKVLTTRLLNKEVDDLVKVINNTEKKEDVLGNMIKAFYTHYINNLDAFRAVYCQLQFAKNNEGLIDAELMREEINPRTRLLFDTLEEKLASEGMRATQRKEIRRLAFSAWLSALGLMTMLSLAQATRDPLIHNNEDLVRTLSTTFNASFANN